MPVYEYACQKCKQIFEEWQSGFEKRELSCSVCGGRSIRLVSNSSFVLKGDGWYVTDYSSRKMSPDESTPTNKANASGETKVQVETESKTSQT